MTPLIEAGGEALPLDLCDPSSIEDLARAIQERGGADALINNAGYGLYGPVETIPIEEARRQFEVNLFGLARLTQLVIQGMRSKGAGRIVNISSMGGRIYTPFGAWYHATKHALEGWSDCLRIELQPFGIHVVIVEPGVIETGFGGPIEEPLLRHSRGTPYESAATAMAATTRKSYGKGGGSPPRLIAEVVSRALRSPRPRTRYLAGKHARLFVAVRTIFGDRAFDAALSSMTK
jgi:short-subunit dehydrogenase